MEVWIVWEEIHWEGGVSYGVFSTEEKALKCKADNGGDTGLSTIHVEKYILDQE